MITGFNDEEELLYTLRIDGGQGAVEYDRLGRLEIPILSVLTVRDRTERTQQEITDGMLRIARAHLKGEEWCDNAKGLEAYPALIAGIREKLSADSSWNLEYYLGTYAALKQYALKYFEKYGHTALAEKYRVIFGEWMAAFRLKREKDALLDEVKEEIIAHLQSACEAESGAAELMAQH